MTWRPMNSLARLDDPRAGLRGQVNAIAPYRSKASDGLVGDQNHETTSGHYPHFVAGVGDEIVTAWDVTNDPDGGCDSFKLCEVLRQHRDKRLRYVISNRQIFSSYPVGSRPAWTWGPYSGTTDPHINHGHIQVLDEPISDTSTPWNLEGFEDMSITDVTTGIKNAEQAAAKRTFLAGTEASDPTGKYGRDLNNAQNEIAARQLQPVMDALDELTKAVAALALKIDNIPAGGAGNITISGTLSGGISGSFSGNTA